MNVYTKKGDKGETSLFGGSKIFKDDLRVWCYGTIDEANSVLGLVYASLKYDDLKNIVREIQQKLFVVGAEMASDEKGLSMLKVGITDDDVKSLELIIDDYTKDFGKLKNFTIPGETETSALFHLARTVVRRGERYMVSLSREDYINPVTLKYINRLSDALYILAKIEVFKNFVSKVAERINALENENLTSNIDNCFYEKLCNVAKVESEKLNVKISFAFVDCNGNLAFFKRFDDSILASIDVAMKKAYTAVSLKMPTGDLKNLVEPSGIFYGLNTIDSKFVTFAGGFPLIKDGKLLGGIGISGGSDIEDEKIGRKVLEYFLKEI